MHCPELLQWLAAGRQPFSRCVTGATVPAPLKIPDNLTNEKVVLALPVRRGEREEVIFSEEPASLARFIAFEQEVEDDNAMSVGDATVQFGRLRLTLMLEKDLTAEWTAIGVAFVTEKRNDNHVRLDNSYIPPMLNANNSPQIYSMINDLHGLLVQRSQQIGGRLRQPGRFNTSELIDFTLLSLVNRHLGEVSHLKNPPAAASGNALAQLAAVCDRARHLDVAAYRRKRAADLRS